MKNCKIFLEFFHSNSFRKNLDRIPCASLLIRIFKAPTTKDGMIVLSKAYVPENEWKEKEVDIPAPSYESGKYNNELCIPTTAEKYLFPKRQNRENPSTRDMARNLMKNEAIVNLVTSNLNDIF